ncbi:MAG TPA: BTAD domain-containing putative transcriptional regulator [Symbiobacteriaceae bacterium]|nr:BTAD domain-containing putative transcriptional regulator [Symbiobacteriaceae bacterium]
MKDPLAILFGQPDAKLTPQDVEGALAAGDYAAAVEALWQVGAQVFQGDLDRPLESLVATLDQLPPAWQQTTHVRYIRAWLCNEQHRDKLAMLLLDELAAEWSPQLGGPAHNEAAHWLLLIRLGQGVVAESQGWWDPAREAFAESMQYLPADLQEQAGRMGAGWEWREAARLAAADPEGLGPVMTGALGQFRTRGNQPALARVAHALGCYLLKRGEPAAARHWLEQALELRSGQAGHLPLACTLLSLGACYQQVGLLQEAQETLDRLLRLVTDLDHPTLQAAGLSHLADVQRDREEFEAARDLYEKALALQGRLRDHAGMVRTYLALSTLHRRVGQYGLAADAAAEAHNLVVGHLGDAYLAMADLHQQTAGVLLGSDGAALRLQRVVDELAAQHVAREETLGRWYLAVAAHRSGDAATAATHLREALTRASRDRTLHLIAMELPATADLCQVALAQQLLPDALAGLVQRASSRGLGALLEQVPGARPLVAAAGRLPDSTALSVWLLGPFRVQRAGRPVDLGAARSQKAVSLFKFLVAQRGRPAAREQILDAIWADSPPGSADRSFEVTLSTLRRVLDPPDGPSLVLRRGRGYLLNPDVPVVVDVDRFAHHVDRGNWWWQRGQAALAVAEWTTAEAAYGGDFLADDPYEDWATAERDRLREQYLDLVLQLGEVALQEGRWGEAAERAYRILGADPVRESAYRLLMRVHARQGNRAAAVRDLQRCADTLRRELGEEPMWETWELARRIRLGERP